MMSVSAASSPELAPSENTFGDSTELLSREKRAAPPCYPCHGVSGDCFHGWQACDGNRQCPGGEDEANCVHPEMGQQYRRRADKTLLRGAGRRIFFTGISLRGCGMVCTHMEPNCRAFTYSDREPTRTCTLYTRPGKSYESVGTMLYERQGPPVSAASRPAAASSASSGSPPRGPALTLLDELFVVKQPVLTEPVEQDLSPLARVGITARCASADAYQCSADQCIPAWNVCDGGVECVGGSEEKLCKSLARAFEEADEPRPASRRLARPTRVKTRNGCAAACLWHWSGGRACTAFVFDGRCELGCLDCGGDGRWLAGKKYEQLSPLTGMAALFDQLQPLPEAERGMALRAMYRIGSVVNGHDALGDQKFELQGNNEIDSFDSSARRLTTPALPPNVLQRAGGKTVQGKYRTTVVGYMYTSREVVDGSVVPMYVTGASISFTNPALADSNLATRIRTTRTSRRRRTKSAKGVQPTRTSTVSVQKTAQPFKVAPAPPRAIESSSAPRRPPPPTTRRPRPTPRPSPPPVQRVAVQPSLSSSPHAPATDGFGAPLGETPTCGRRPVDDALQTRGFTQTLRVVGGNPASYGKYPWQAQLLAFNSSSGQFEHQCGAVIVGAHHLLTAAHCTTGGPRLRALVGVSDRSRPDEPERQAFDVANAVAHPQYLAGPHGSYSDDIAVVRIRGEGIRFSAFVQPLCLPRGSGGGHAGQMCQISGWGRREFDSPSEAELQLRGASVPIVSDPFCSTREVHGERFRPGKMVCAGALSGGTDSCQGDSGGPLACADKAGRWTAVGIVSYGVGCGIVNKPGVYTKVEQYVDWIEGVMRFV